MAKRPNIIPKAPAARILLNMGAKRVSADAIDAFVDVITQISEDIGLQAVRVAKHSGRKTIHESDIKLASR
jgi:histone H3/H4